MDSDLYLEADDKYHVVFGNDENTIPLPCHAWASSGEENLKAAYNAFKLLEIVAYNAWAHGFTAMIYKATNTTTAYKASWKINLLYDNINQYLTFEDSRTLRDYVHRMNKYRILTETDGSWKKKKKKKQTKKTDLRMKKFY